MLDGLLRAGVPPAVAMTLHEGDALVGAVLRRADRGVLVSGLPPRYAGAVAEALAGTELPGAVGPVAEAEAFADAWPAPVAHRFDQRLFALGTLTPPAGVPGAARPATEADAVLLGAWRAAFTAETGVGQVSAAHAPPEVAVGPGEWVWQVDDQRALPPPGLPLPARRGDAGVRLGRHIVELLDRKAADLSEEDLKRMRKVVGYVHRHLAQRPSGDVTETKWRYSLMNWGHDPLK